MAARDVLVRKRKPISDPEKRQRSTGPQTALSGNIYCKQCARTYPWPPGSKEEAKLYRVFLLNEDDKSFFCDSECYWGYNYPTPQGTDQTESWKVQAVRYGLPPNCGVDWNAKIKPPEDCWEDVGEYGMAAGSDDDTEMSCSGAGSNDGGTMDMPGVLVGNDT